MPGLMQCLGATYVLTGPDGTRDLVAGLLDVFEYLRGRVDVTVREVGDPSGGDEDVEDVEGADGDPQTPTFELAGYELSTAPMVHSAPGYAYRLAVAGTDGPAFAFSGDTEATAGIADLADGSAVLAHDCSFPDSVDVDNHPTPSELGEALAGADAEVGRVYLTHLYPHTDGEHEAMLESIADRYDGDVRFASDGLSLDIE
jgi:ribonuclease BN (tRNA processing enzyme)